MAELTIVYWRDIPAQVIAGKGRRAASFAEEYCDLMLGGLRS